MKQFIIEPVCVWHAGVKRNVLSTSIVAFYHDDYHAGDKDRRLQKGTVENVICTLKNQFNDVKREDLLDAGKALVRMLYPDFKQIIETLHQRDLVVCVVPRAKKEDAYKIRQRFFKVGVTLIAKSLSLEDGTMYIQRVVDTRTTHLNKAGYGGEGAMPYPGITRETCCILDDVCGKHILLVDDLYTKSVNIDEDAIQALLDKGAKSVVFYSLGKTMSI